MRKGFPLLGLVPMLALTMLLATGAQAQKAGPYSISAVTVTKFNKMTGEFGERIGTEESTSFFNELDLSLFAVIEVSGTAEGYAPGRRVQITVTEGKRVALRTTADIGVINQSGKYFVPVFLPGPYCSEVKITAKILGQTKQSAMSRKLGFVCGE